MAESSLSPGAQAELLRVLVNKRLNAKADRSSARKAIVGLNRCKNTFIEWKAEEARVNQRGDSLFVYVPPPPTPGLERIVSLAARLRRELLSERLIPPRKAFDGGGPAFLRGLWNRSQEPDFGIEPVSQIPWDTIIQSISEVERVASTLSQPGKRAHETANDKMRRAFAAMVGGELCREGYRVSTTGNGTYARVMKIMFEEVGERVPKEESMQNIARETVHILRHPKNVPLSSIPRRRSKMGTKSSL